MRAKPLIALSLSRALWQGTTEERREINSEDTVKEKKKKYYQFFQKILKCEILCVDWLCHSNLSKQLLAPASPFLCLSQPAAASIMLRPLRGLLILSNNKECGGQVNRETYIDLVIGLRKSFILLKPFSHITNLARKIFHWTLRKVKKKKFVLS